MDKLVLIEKPCKVELPQNRYVVNFGRGEVVVAFTSSRGNQVLVIESADPYVDEGQYFDYKMGCIAFPGILRPANAPKPPEGFEEALDVYTSNNKPYEVRPQLLIHKDGYGKTVFHVEDGNPLPAYPLRGTGTCELLRSKSKRRDKVEYIVDFNGNLWVRDWNGCYGYMSGSEVKYISKNARDLLGNSYNTKEPKWAITARLNGWAPRNEEEY